MAITGGCYCRALRYEAEEPVGFRAQGHCRECQYITGGSPNMFLAMPPNGFKYTKGTAKQFSRSDLEKPVTLRRVGPATARADSVAIPAPPLPTERAWD